MIELVVLTILTVALALSFTQQPPASGLAADVRRILLQIREISRETNYAISRSYELMTTIPQDTDEHLRQPELRHH
jgi:hypothetical protein